MDAHITTHAFNYIHHLDHIIVISKLLKELVLIKIEGLEYLVIMRVDYLILLVYALVE